MKEAIQLLDVPNLSSNTREVVVMLKVKGQRWPATPWTGCWPICLCL